MVNSAEHMFSVLLNAFLIMSAIEYWITGFLYSDCCIQNLENRSMGLVLDIDIRFVSTMELHKLEAWMLYGRTCHRFLFSYPVCWTVNSFLESQYRLCLMYDNTGLICSHNGFPSQSSSSFYWVYMILEGLINIVITRHNIDLSCPGTDTMFIQFNLERYP